MSALVNKLRDFNSWRRGKEGAKPIDATEIRRCIDEACEILDEIEHSGGCPVCADIKHWNEEEYMEDPIDEHYGAALKLLKNKTEKYEIAEVIARLLRNKS